MTDITIVIPSYNSQDNLPRTLAAISEQNFNGSKQVVVVDCSETNAVELICNSFEFVKYQHESQRFNPGIGRNIGAKLADGELLVFVDSDVVLLPDALMQAWEYYRAGHEVFGGALELNEEVCATPAAYLEHFFFNHESQAGRPACARSNLSSALMLFKKALFLESGGFKDIPRMQDTELTERLIKEGIKLSFNPAVVGLQIQDSPMRKVLRKIFINGKNLYFIRYQKQSLSKRALLFLFLPLLTGLKILRIIFRHLKYQSSRNRLITLALTPLLFFGGLYWMLGLYRSMIFGGGISAKRD